MSSRAPSRIQSFMSDSSDFGRTSIETFTPAAVPWNPPKDTFWEARENRWRRKSLAIALVLFFLTLLSTLAVGTQFAFSYAAGKTPDFDQLFSTYGTLLARPALLMTGVPFAFTLLGILLAH